MSSSPQIFYADAVLFDMVCVFILDNFMKAELIVYRMVLSRTRQQQLKLLGAKSQRKLGRILNTSLQLLMASVLPNAYPVSNQALKSMR